MLTSVGSVVDDQLLEYAQQFCFRSVTMGEIWPLVADPHLNVLLPDFKNNFLFEW